MNAIQSVASIFLSFLLLVSPAARASDSLRTVKSPMPIPANIKVPEGFKATVIADRLGGARHIAVAANGDVFVKLSRLLDGNGIIRLRDANKDDLYEQQSA